jgi:CDP-diglyceride synthetase|tara:strand:+ start:19910 stop:20398 length:489 start_codon:yes stop_codon:yes gene_type:complete
MVQETILQHWIFTQFALPFLLIFAVLYGILEKTEILGKGKHQINAIVSFVVGLIFVGFAYPKLVVENLILFLVVALVVVFVALLLWGFIAGEAKIEGNMKKVLVGVVIIAVIAAVFWAMGIDGGAIDLLFKQDWSNTFWTNVAFVVVIAIALALILKNSKDS